MALVELPRALAEAYCSVPPLTASLPSKVLFPDKVSMLAPLFVMPPTPLIAPENVNDVAVPAPVNVVLPASARLLATV